MEGTGHTRQNKRMCVCKNRKANWPKRAPSRVYEEGGIFCFVAKKWGVRVFFVIMKQQEGGPKGLFCFRGLFWEVEVVVFERGGFAGLSKKELCLKSNNPTTYSI